uniref:GTPase Obg n=1 Tax=uncultured bacterium contig00042 TaxID=1181529 RepID=A0A806KDE1_9BACT|nr:GTP-binding protein Obg [uncultured bacterium contig00042]
MEKFADEAIIEVSSGSGGNGCASFRREKYVPRGGPSGGDGGRGGNVVFTVRRNLRTLAHLRYKYSFKAENGRDGESAGRYGHHGADVIVPLPPGSLIRDAETGDLIRDFSNDKEDFIFLKGGNGGWGNIHFKSSVNQAPRKALPGKPGQTVKLKVELQIMADIGLVGFPNAGKSSLLDRFTNARPKIAAYPFTTKIPNLGVLTLDERDVIIADIPGLIEGASEGAGLGFRFLKHIFRTSALAFLIDLSDDNYLEAFDILLKELGSYSEDLAQKKRLLAGTKTDLPETEGRLDELKAKYTSEEIMGVSVFSGEGVKELSYAFLRLIKTDDDNNVADDSACEDSSANMNDGQIQFEGEIL